MISILKYKFLIFSFMCDRRSTWDVILHSKDFTNVVPSDGPAPDTIFNILQPYPNGRFTLVLDRSASMEDFDRMKRVRKAKISTIKQYLLNINGPKMNFGPFFSQPLHFCQVLIWPF